MWWRFCCISVPADLQGGFCRIHCSSEACVFSDVGQGHHTVVVGNQDDVNGGKIQQFPLQSKYTGICLFLLREDKLCNGSESCKSTAIETSTFVWCNGGGGGWEEVPQEGRTLAVNPQTLFLHILSAPGKMKKVVFHLKALYHKNLSIGTSRNRTYRAR